MDDWIWNFHIKPVVPLTIKMFRIRRKNAFIQEYKEVEKLASLLKKFVYKMRLYT